ncbi:hypothetical protein [Helicobacter pylori]|uniref:hypothetical protein n=1 Tax=Helicobacter pylori TaxID=210 RepID=UPI003F9023A0
MRQKKASTSLKKSRKRYENKNSDPQRFTHKTRLKPLTRESKKSVLEPELKNILTPKTPTHN